MPSLRLLMMIFLTSWWRLVGESPLSHASVISYLITIGTFVVASPSLFFLRIVLIFHKQMDVAVAVVVMVKRWCQLTNKISVIIVNVVTLRRHRHIDHMRKWTCAECKRVFYVENALAQHVASKQERAGVEKLEKDELVITAPSTTDFRAWKGQQGRVW